MKKAIILISWLSLIFIPAMPQTALRVKHFNLEKGIALQGYDPVAYFIVNKAIKGKSQNPYTHEGVTYLFSSTANLEAFKKNPQNYEPQYGGWCAYAMGAVGEKVEIDPETFKITEGKLFLFYRSWINNTLPKWNEAEKSLLPKADRNWMNTYN